MTQTPNEGLRQMAAISGCGERVREAQAEAVRPFWDSVVVADERLAILFKTPDWRIEIEARIRAWENELHQVGWRREWSRPEILALSNKVFFALLTRKSLPDEEFASIFNDIRALTYVAEGSDLDVPVTTLFLSLVADDMLGQAFEAVQVISALPEKNGGRGSYTANLRKKSIVAFGEAMVPIIRAAGISLGGNSNRDTAFALFLEAASQHVTGEPIAGKDALLARLRKL